jgi:uncharacterized protein YkwD
MKTITLILSVLVSLSFWSQGPYKLYSKVWKLSICNGDKLTFIPIDNSKYFNYLKTDSISRIVNMSLVNTHLLKSFNEFRTDYASPKVNEDLDLSLTAQKYSKKLVTDFKHDDFNGDYYFECISMFPMVFLDNIKPTDGDLNKLVSECVFDSFVISKAHMDFLLDKEITKVGFGVYNDGKCFYIVVRGY